MYGSGGEILPLQRSELSEISASPPIDAAKGSLQFALGPVIVYNFSFFWIVLTHSGRVEREGRVVRNAKRCSTSRVIDAQTEQRIGGKSQSPEEPTSRTVLSNSEARMPLEIQRSLTKVVQELLEKSRQAIRTLERDK